MTPTLVTERLKLVAIGMEYCSTNYLSWLNDSEVNIHLESPNESTLEDLKGYIAMAVGLGKLFWVILESSSGKHIGNIKIDPINESDASGEYGIMIGDKRSWGKGYAKEASNAVFNYCFGKLGLSSITLGVLVSNLSAVKLYEKMRFETYETKLIYRPKTNQYEECLRMRLIKDEHK